MSEFPPKDEEEDLSPSEERADEFADEFEALARDVRADRAYGGTPSTEMDPSGVPLESRETAIANLRLLRAMNGHRGSMLRRRAKEGKGALSAHLSSLYALSRGEGDPDSLLALPEGLGATGDLSSEALYERATFLSARSDVALSDFETASLSAARDALGLPSNKNKWIDLIGPVFSGPDPKSAFEKLFSSLGYVPGDLTTRKAFQKVPPQALMKSIAALRELEDGEYGEAARYERSRLLNAMIAQGNLKTLRDAGASITLDTNGLFVNAGELHAHLPYGLLEERAIAALERDEWVSKEAENELELRAAEENNHPAERERLEKEQFEHFKEITNEEGDPEELAERVALDPEGFAKRVVRGSHVIPKALVDALLARGAEGVSLLARIGESVGDAIVEEKEGNRYRMLAHSGYRSHRLLHVSDEEYEDRSKIVNDPRYYNSYRAMRAVLSAIPEHADEEEFVALRGSYKKTRAGDRHSFIEVIRKGDASRILVNEDKHLPGGAKEDFERLPLYEREGYEDLERVLDSYGHFHDSVKVLERFPGFGSEFGRWVDYRSAMETTIYFLLAHSSPELHREAEKEAERYWADIKSHHARETAIDAREQRIKKGEDAGEEPPEFVQSFDPEALYRVAERADREYRKLLYRSISNETTFIENFMPEVVKSDVSFGPEFAEGARGGTVSWGRDEKLSGESASVRVVRIDHKEEGVMPFHIEEAALDALRLPRKRPLINVIGGARQMEVEGVDALSAMSAQILSVAHRNKTNVAVPGTQSGIGITFGRENIRYKHATSHLPHADRAHMFAVSPGGNTYFPGNPYLTKENTDQTYALSPVDSIITPFSVNWDAQGLAKRDSPYIDHVKYMEALYSRIAAGQRKIAVVGNGGLYATMEITEAYRKGFDIFFIEDSGRLAQVVSAMLGSRYSPSFSGEYHGGKGNGFDDDDTCYKAVMDALAQLPVEVREEFIKKDFGMKKSPENDDYLVYREYFYRMLRALREQTSNHISHTPLADLEESLEQYLTVEVDNDFRYPMKQVYIEKDDEGGA